MGPAEESTKGGQGSGLLARLELWGVPRQGEGPKGRARARSGPSGLPGPARVTASIGGLPALLAGDTAGRGGSISREPGDQGRGLQGPAGSPGRKQGCGALKAVLHPCCPYGGQTSLLSLGGAFGSEADDPPRPPTREKAGLCRVKSGVAQSGRSHPSTPEARRNLGIPVGLGVT